jgi:hypothetical protein
MSPAQAVFDMGERTNKHKADRKSITLLLLDWEKAFDKIPQKGLFEAMERMKIHPKLINLTKQLYKNPKFKVEIDGIQSSWKTQETGIRQGCTLSPYLFLILMTVLFMDVYDDPELAAELEEHRPPNHDADDVLYADDTIIFSTNNITISKLLHKIETCAGKYNCIICI